MQIKNAGQTCSAVLFHLHAWNLGFPCAEKMWLLVMLPRDVKNIFLFLTVYLEKIAISPLQQLSMARAEFGQCFHVP